MYVTIEYNSPSVVNPINSRMFIVDMSVCMNTNMRRYKILTAMILRFSNICSYA